VEATTDPKVLTVREELVAPLVDMARAAGLAPGDILRGSGAGRVRLADYFRLQQAIARAVEDEAFQMSERQLLPGATDFVLSRLSGTTSLHDATKVLATYYNLLHGGEFNSVVKRGGIVSIRTDDRKFPYTVKDRSRLQFTMECVQIFLHSMLATISERQANEGLRRVSVTRAQGGPDAEHLAFWRAPVRYGAAVYTLDYDEGAMTATVPVPPPELLTASRVYEEVAALIDARECGAAPAHSAAALIREALRSGGVDQRKAARLLGVSVATLRRRLAEEGASFRELRREELNATARAMLVKQRRIADVADALGFSDFRSFNRAFREWNGVSPKAFQAGQMQKP
jgi:AraC-like DNA-binding protein